MCSLLLQHASTQSSIMADVIKGRRPKRRCVSTKAAVPSAIHYVGYVEEDETPEMIMKKFEELEKVRTLSPKRPALQRWGTRTPPWHDATTGGGGGRHREATGQGARRVGHGSRGGGAACGRACRRGCKRRGRALRRACCW